MWWILAAGMGRLRFRLPGGARGTVYALDIEPEMIATVAAKAKLDGLPNVSARLRDFVADGTGLPDEYVDYAMLLNILHAENPQALLAEARRVLSAWRNLGHHALEL